MDEELKGISLVVLGIVALLSLVGLVLLFSQATKTGQVARAGYPDAVEWYDQRAEVAYGEPGAPYDAASRRVGQATPAGEYSKKVSEETSTGRDNEHLLITAESPRYKLLVRSQQID